MNYSMQEMKENMAKAYGKSLGISTKTSIEIANHLRGRTTTKAKWILEQVLQKKQAIPFKRFTDGVGHRPGGIGAGRYPQKASEEFLKLVKQAEANAQAKGLSENLIIVHLSANKASSQFRQGRQRRRKFKRCHLEIVVQEMDAPKKKAEKKTEEKPAKKEPEKKVEQPVDKKPSVKETKPAVKENKEEKETPKEDKK